MSAATTIASTSTPDPSALPDAVVPTKDLHRAVTEAARFTSGRVHLPALACVLLRAGGDTLELEASDLDVAFRQRLTDGVTVDASGEVLVPCRELRDVLKVCEADQVRLHVGDGRLVVDDDGDRFSFELRHRDDFPQLPATTRTRLCADLPELLRRVLPATSSDEARPVLTAVRLEPAGAAATDSFRLAYAAGELDVRFEALVPGGAVRAILKSRPSRLAVGYAKGWTTFEDRDNGRSWVVRDVEGSFPNWRQLIPAEHTSSVMFDRTEMARVVKKAATQAGPNVPVEVSADDGKVNVSCGTDAVRLEAAVDATLDGPAAKIAFDPQFLLAALTDVLTGDKVQLRLRDELKPGILSDDGPVAYLLMPMRVA